jgi:hypothetical protein
MQGSAGMQGRIIDVQGLTGLLPMSVPAFTSLTRRCSRRPLTASLRHRLMGAAELGR